MKKDLKIAIKCVFRLSSNTPLSADDKNATYMVAFFVLEPFCGAIVALLVQKNRKSVFARV